MIVSMRRAFIVARQSDRKALLEALAHAGLVHIQPIDPAKAVAEEQTLASLDRAGRAIQVLGEHQPSGDRPALKADQAADEVLRIQREQAEAQARLAALHRQIEHLALWGDVQLDQFRQLEQAGVNVTFHSVPARLVPEARADVVQVLCELPAKRVLVATVMRSGEAVLPEGTEPLPLPQHDRPTLRADAARIDQAIRQRQVRLGELAHLRKDIQDWQTRLGRQAQFGVAERSGLDNPDLYAIQGWVPEDRAQELPAAVQAAGIDAAVQTAPPAQDDLPPTEIRLPRWAEPIRGLMQILNIHPGYHEQDVSPSFVIALPLFAAMLISDAGYGSLFLLLPLLFYRKMVAAAGRDLTHLVMLIGGASIVWGLLIGSFFGVDLARLFFGPDAHPLVVVSLEQGPMHILMRLSFTIGLIHLIIAQLWRGLVVYPNLAFVSKIGWALVLTGMYSVVTAFVLKTPESMTSPLILVPIIVGAVLAIGFASPGPNILKGVALGMANFPLSFIGTFSDIMSYVRLMAVGLAGSVLAANFNDLAVSAGPLLMVPVLFFGHALNVGLAMIALFAHGVRLNVLEFSNNFGLEWSGYPYQPFRQETLAGE